MRTIPCKHIATIALLLCGAALRAESPAPLVRFPADHGFLDVRAGFEWEGRAVRAAGDGVADDTEALQTALLLAMKGPRRVVYLPAGTYRVTGSLTLGDDRGRTRRVILQGQGPEHSIVRLDDAQPRFQDADKPVPVVSFLDNPSGGHNQAFRNSVFDLAIDVGRDNPGATALRFVNSNQGAIVNVVLRAQPSADGRRRGARGLDLMLPWPGPGMLRDLIIEGFDVGLDIGHYQYSMTGENLVFRAPGVAAIRNFHNLLFLRKVRYEGSVPFYLAGGDQSMLVMLDSELKGRDAPAAAFDTNGEVLLRRVRAEGFAVAVVNRQKGMANLVDAAVLEGEYSSAGTVAAFPDSIPGGLDLPIEAVPSPPYDPPENWVRVDPSGDDHTAAVQAAIDAAGQPGKGTVYFPSGRTYTLTDTIHVRGGVRRILGLDARIQPSGRLVSESGVLFRFAGLTSDSVSLERFDGGWPGSHETALVFFESDTDKAIVLKHLCIFGTDHTIAYRNGANGRGRAFIEDVTLTPWHFSNGQHVWAWQLNPESGTRPNVVVDGATFWVLGLKTEYGQINVWTKNGGTSEVLGAYVYPAGVKVPPDRPSFVIEDSRASLTFREGGNNRHTVQVRETRAGESRESNEMPFWCMPLYRGAPATRPEATEAHTP